MRALVLHLYVVAKEVGTSAEKIATALREQPTDQDREHAREAITHIVRQLQSAGVTKDDIMEQFQKYLRTSAQPTKPQAD
jgi:DNA-binding transcriptional regulator YhcF (GntR family)